MNWLYEYVPLQDDFTTDDYGFIYKITNLESNKFYIGRKSFVHNKKKKLTKKEIAEQTGPGRRSTTKVEQIDSGWRKYWGSSKDLLADVKLLGEDKFEREILKFCPTKKQLTFYEIQYQIQYSVLFTDTYNDNILGKFFRKDFVQAKYYRILQVMENAALLVLLESVLGTSHKTSRGNYSFKCPFCQHHKNKLEINVVTNEKSENPWHCWVCEAKGKTIRSLFKSVKVPTNKTAELNMIIIPGKKETNQHINVISLPKEFISLKHITKLDKVTTLEAKRATTFLKKRNITQEDIIKYNIGFCYDGPYKDRVIIPSYDENGSLNYFIARAFIDGIQKYKNPPTDAKSAIGLELYINWDAPIILVEGMFDALTIKRNVIPLFGKIIHEKLMKKLVRSSVNRIYIALDPDAIKNAFKYCEELMSYNKEVYLVELTGKDANEIGFVQFLNIIENTQTLDFQSLLMKKFR